MVTTCCVYGCENILIKGGEITYFSFPTDPELKEKWVKAIRRKNFQPSKQTVICSQHFEENSYIEVPDEFTKKILHCDAVPTIFPALPSHPQPNMKKRYVIRGVDEPCTSREAYSIDRLSIMKKDPGRTKTQDKYVQTVVSMLSISSTQHRKETEQRNDSQLEKKSIQDETIVVFPKIEEECSHVLFSPSLQILQGITKVNHRAEAGQRNL